MENGWKEGLDMRCRAHLEQEAQDAVREREVAAKHEQEIADREKSASARWLAPDTAAARVYDIIAFMDSLITCHDVDVLKRAIRVSRHALDPIQKDLEAERLRNYYEAAYGLRLKEF